MLNTSPIVWAKDQEGRRYLCSIDELRDPNFVSSDEKSRCLHDDSELETRRYVPSNSPEGKIRFSNSRSMN